MASDSYPRPSMNGVPTAMVVGPNGEPIMNQIAQHAAQLAHLVDQLQQARAHEETSLMEYGGRREARQQAKAKVEEASAILSKSLSLITGPQNELRYADDANRALDNLGVNAPTLDPNDPRSYAPPSQAPSRLY